MTSEERKREDQILVAKAQAGDRRAYHMLVERYQKRAYSIALGMLKHPEDALDATQEAFVRVYKNLPTFKGEAAFYTWFYRIVVNVCIDHCRKHKKYRNVEFDESYRRRDEIDPNANLNGNTRLLRPDISLDRTELGEAISSAIESLSEKHRTIVILREVEGMSYEEIAAATQCNIGTVMSRLHHARKNLQTQLQEFIHQDDRDHWANTAHQSRRRRS